MEGESDCKDKDRNGLCRKCGSYFIIRLVLFVTGSVFILVGILVSPIGCSYEGCTSPIVTPIFLTIGVGLFLAGLIFTCVVAYKAKKERAKVGPGCKQSGHIQSGVHSCPSPSRPTAVLSYEAECQDSTIPESQKGQQASP